MISCWRVFNNPVGIYAFNTLEHWTADISKNVAEEIQCRCDILGMRCRRISKTLLPAVSSSVGPASAATTLERLGSDEMNWVYWNTFWSLVVSTIWFMTIVSHPHSVVVERHPPKLKGK